MSRRRWNSRLCRGENSYGSVTHSLSFAPLTCCTAGWGVRDITFLDNGRVSYSNPARQVTPSLLCFPVFPCDSLSLSLWQKSLFEYEDCVAKSFKATAAAERSPLLTSSLSSLFPSLLWCRLLKIFPGMRSVGEVLSIPMPGHSIPVGDRDSFVSSVQRLDQLIQGHDVIFALTDSREARWLPTVMCSAHDKVPPISLSPFLSSLSLS
jgi:ubiquitin-like modifier-activating enzyme ATG7